MARIYVFFLNLILQYRIVAVLSKLVTSILSILKFLATTLVIHVYAKTLDSWIIKLKLLEKPRNNKLRNLCASVCIKVTWPFAWQKCWQNPVTNAWQEIVNTAQAAESNVLLHQSFVRVHKIYFLINVTYFRNIRTFNLAMVILTIY